jgi:hypothetical protein
MLPLAVAFAELQWLIHQPGWPAAGLPGPNVPLAGPAQPCSVSQDIELQGHLLNYYFTLASHICASRV